MCAGGATIADPLDLISGLPGKDGLQWNVKTINRAVTLANDQDECD